MRMETSGWREVRIEVMTSWRGLTVEQWKAQTGEIFWCCLEKGGDQLQWIGTATAEWEAGIMSLECWGPSEHVRDDRGKPRKLVAGYVWQPRVRETVKGNPHHVSCWELSLLGRDVALFSEWFLMFRRVVKHSTAQTADMEAAIEYI